MPYLVNSDIANYLQETLSTAEQTTVDQIIEFVSGYADTYCGRTWSKASTDEITETFDGGESVYFPETAVPVSEVVSFKVSDQDYQLSAVHNYGNFLRFEYGTSFGFRNCVLKYKTSATSVPNDLKQALIMWASQLFRSSKHGGKTVSSASSGPVSTTFLAKDGVPEVVQMVLDRYIRLV